MKKKRIVKRGNKFALKSIVLIRTIPFSMEDMMIPMLKPTVTYF